MAITLLYGSLSKNITDIAKGGGCPKIKPPNKKYSVLRYFTKVDVNSIYYTGESGPIADGGHFNHSGDNDLTGGFKGSSTLAGEERVFIYGTLDFNWLSVATGSPIFGNETGSANFLQTNNALNITNQKEIENFGSTYENSIHNIELANDVVDKDGSGYYNYNLYKASHTMDIILAGTSTPVSKTADLMEYVYLHSFIPKCRKGQLYLELEDFDLTGTTTNDYLIYFYYWESTKDDSNIATALINRNNYSAGNANLLYIDENVLCKVVKSSELQGTGTDKKLIVWLNKLKTRAEKFGVNILIGYSPQEIRKDEFVRLYDTTFKCVTNDPIGNIVFKFKKASIKLSSTTSTINSSPICYPSFAYKNLDGNTLGDVVKAFYPITIQLLNSSNIPVGNLGAPGAAGVTFGIKNGGADATPSYLSQAISVGHTTQDTGISSPCMQLLDGYLSKFVLRKFFKVSSALVSGQTYTMRMPNLSDLYAQKIGFNTRSYSWTLPTPGSGYMDEYNSFPTDYTIKIYAGDDCYTSGGYPLYKDLMDSLVLIKTFTASELGLTFAEINSGIDYEIQTDLSYSGTTYNNGTPYNLEEKASIKKNKYRYFTFDASVLPVYPCHFYMCVCKTGIDIKTISYGITVDTTTGGGDPAYYRYLPTGYSTNYNTYEERGGLDFAPEYSRSFADGVATDSRVYRNYGAQIFKSAQIINKADNPTAENYYA